MWYAVALLIASTVGIGFFGLPYAFAQAGVGVGMMFLVGLTCIVMISNLIYGEIVLRTHTRHEFVGYVRLYLGPWARYINLCNFWVSMYGAFIGVLILNGTFLSHVLHAFGWDVAPAILSTVFLTIVAIMVYGGLKTVSHVDFFLTAAVCVIIGMTTLYALPHVHFGNYVVSTGFAWFLPFGVILFSLNGLQSVPLVRETLAGHEHQYRKALVIGTLLPSIIYAMFALTVVGVVGVSVSPEAIPSLAEKLGSGVAVLVSALGFLTSSTIFMNILNVFRASLAEDLRIRKRWAFLVILLPGFILFLLGVRNYIQIIGLVGGVAVSIDSILLLLMYVRAKSRGTRIPEYSLRLPLGVIYLMIGLFLLGAIYTITA